MSDPRAVAVFGSSGARPGEPAYAAAEQVGRVLAGLGYAVANGGYGGAMEAVSRGAAGAGAEVIGVTCRIWPTEPNRFLTRVVPTRDRYERLRTLMELGSGGYVVLGGSTGTLLELALSWELSAKGPAADRPIVCVGGHWRPLAELMRRSDPRAAACLRFVDCPDELPGHFRRCGLKRGGRGA